MSMFALCVTLLVSLASCGLCTGRPSSCFCGTTADCTQAVEQELGDYEPSITAKRALVPVVGVQTSPVCVHGGPKRDLIFYRPVCESTDGLATFLCDTGGDSVVHDSPSYHPYAASGFCCEGPLPVTCGGAGGAQEGGVCTDATSGVDGGKCHFGTCVGCIASPTTTSSLCGCEDSSATLGFQVSANIKRGGSSSAGLCATVAPFPAQTTQGTLAVQISNWTIVPSSGSVSGIDAAYLKQFEGVFSYHVANGRVELSCLPVDGFTCAASTLVFNVGGDFCYAEFNVGDRKRDGDDNRIIGGSLLANDPFGLQVTQIAAAVRVGGHHRQQ